MAAATVTERYNTALQEEVVLLEVSDGETYTSSLSKPLVAFANSQAANTATVVCTISGRTITFISAGATDVAVAVCIKGYL